MQTCPPPFSFADDARTVCIIAGGPSVTPAAAAHTRGWPCIVVNDAWRLAPWAAVLYACDWGWWHHHIAAVRAADFAGQLWTQNAKAAAVHKLQRIPGIDATGLCRTPGLIHFGENGGYQAINLAYHWGAKRLILLGYDCKTTDRSHWFGRHPAGLEKNPHYQKWIANFTVLAADLKREKMEVINCSLISALTCWPKQPVELALARRLADSPAAGVPA